jgi:flavin-dependent dehydrogenase
MTSGVVWDVLIIGGGPAGCSAAVTLAGAGVKTLVCEAGTFPRSKVCGEFLSPECTQLLTRLGLGTLLRDSGAHPIEAVQLTAPGGAAWTAALPGAAWGLSRRALDDGLAQRALQQGAALRQATTAVGLSGGLARGFEVDLRTTRGKTERVRARAVVAAYGKRSALDRIWARDFFHRPHAFVGLKAHFRGPSLSNRVVLHSFAGGYCGLAEVEAGRANVSLLVDERTFRGRCSGQPAGPAAFVDWMRRQNSHLDDWLARAEPVEEKWLSIGQVSFGAKHAVLGDVLMAGDAAGLMAPLAGDGIAMALQSGLMAGGQCLDFLAGRMAPARLRGRYAAAWRGEFSGRLILARMLQAFMLRPRLFAGALGLLTAFPQLGRHLILSTRSASHTEVAL